MFSIGGCSDDSSNNDGKTDGNGAGGKNAACNPEQTTKCFVGDLYKAESRNLVEPWTVMELCKCGCKETGVSCDPYVDRVDELTLPATCDDVTSCVALHTYDCEFFEQREDRGTRNAYLLGMGLVNTCDYAVRCSGWMRFVSDGSDSGGESEWDGATFDPNSPFGIKVIEESPTRVREIVSVEHTKLFMSMQSCRDAQEYFDYHAIGN